jgi:hypothetical protein
MEEYALEGLLILVTCRVFIAVFGEDTGLAQGA